MSGSEAVTAIRSAVAALNRGDLEGYLGHFAPDCPRWIPGGTEPLSLAEVGDNLRQLHAGLDDLTLHEDLLFGDETHACARWRLTGRHVRTCYGLAPTGRSLDVPTCEVYELRGGVVTASWVYGDPADLFVQLGPQTGAAR
jgi:ketosteroid isomerase-like protein